MRAHQKLCRQISDRPGPALSVFGGSADPALHDLVTNDHGQSLVVVQLCGQCGELALHVQQVIEERSFDRVFVQA